MVYRPRNVPQDDGSRHQWENCTMASGATAIDRHTLGRIRTTGARMRACQYDQSGGTDLSDLRVAWSRCFSQNLDVRLKVSWATFIRTIKSGRGAVVVGWYSYIPLRYRGQTSASYGHAMFINEVRASDGALLLYDPLRSSAIWIPQIYVKRYAGAMRLSGGGTIGYGYIQAAFTKDTDGLSAPAPSTTTVVLRYGGIKITPTTYKAKIAAKQRRSPYIRSDNIIRVASVGTAFKAYQRTNSGTNVGGSRVWYGNAAGTVWMHSSVLRK
jgi:hypothetical protein